MVKRYRVDLTEEERACLLDLTQHGQGSARRLRRAHTLLLAAEGYSDEAIARALHSGRATVERTRKRFVEEGLDPSLAEHPRPGGSPKLDGKQQAFLLALACSDAPQGQKRWTMQLLADRMVALGVVESLSDETVRRTLKKGESSRG